MIVTTRFAPSPTGRLHLGHAFAARVARDFARLHGGRFLLRHEDIDGSRVRPEYYDAAEADLRWLGLEWDGPPLRQTSRIPAYELALEALKARQVVYPCFCTRREILDEIARIASAPQGPEGPLYPGICRSLSTAERESRIAARIPHAWRLDAAAARAITGPLSFLDLKSGHTAVNPELLGDVVLARKDIGTAYHLAVVVDDAFQRISHVTRGEDLLSSTHVHRILQAILDLPEPVYFHHSLILDENGKRLAKRHDALALSAMRERGMLPEEIPGKIQAEAEILAIVSSITSSND